MPDRGWTSRGHDQAEPWQFTTRRARPRLSFVLQTVVSIAPDDGSTTVLSAQEIRRYKQATAALRQVQDAVNPRPRKRTAMTSSSWRRDEDVAFFRSAPRDSPRSRPPPSSSSDSLRSRPPPSSSSSSSEAPRSRPSLLPIKSQFPQRLQSISQALRDFDARYRARQPPPRQLLTPVSNRPSPAPAPSAPAPLVPAPSRSSTRSPSRSPSPPATPGKNRQTKPSTCRGCGTSFDSRNQLFEHLEAAGHARHGGSPGKAPMVRKEGSDWPDGLG
ncbi:hypothetical protein QBC39DRAFT_114614 [Podospora conica]|nr:hypothetical protein QBC39DRAFT_114614 [Schizothecium conicum]